MVALVSLWTEIRNRFEAAGLETPVLDARLLVEAGAGVSRLDIVTDPRREIGEAQAAAAHALADRRLAREPVAQIVGFKDFWKQRFIVSREVLSPRPETEFVVEAALEAIDFATPARVLDLGTGSGAILLAILADRPLASGVGVDASEAALAVARANAAALGLEARAAFQRGDWTDHLEERFDIVVSNPPYIAAGDFAALAPEVALFEPRLALEGGVDGLDAYRALMPGMAARLKSQGVFALEVGRGQSEAVAALARAAGLIVQGAKTDLGGVTRVVHGRKP